MSTPFLILMLALLSVGTTQERALGSVAPRHPFGAHTFTYAAESVQPSHVDRSQLDAATQRFFDAWRGRYLVSGCGPGRYYVFVNAGRKRAGSGRRSISFSEGHGYGMMITALMAGADADAQTYFDGLYRFFQDHPSRISPYLMAWNQVRGCRNLANDGADSATDGDLDIAYALILADRQWGSAGPINYLHEAQQVINAIHRSEFNPVTSVMLLGGFATPSMPAFYFGTRSSDFMPDHFRGFQTVTGDASWTRAIDTGYHLITSVQAHFSPSAGLVPDFIQQTNTSPRPAAPGYLEGAHDGQYSYNACRVPWRLATDYLVHGDRRALTVVDAINAWIRRATGGNPALIHDGYGLNGVSFSNDSSMAFVAPFAVGAMVSPDSQQWLNALWDLMVNTPLDDSDYYGNTIKMLAMILVSGNWWAP